MYKRYKNIVIESIEEPPTEDEIRAIEWKLETKLPYDFLDFLDVANGGDIEGYYIQVPLSPNPENIGFSHVYSTHGSNYGTFLAEYEFRTGLDPDNPFWIPDKVLPIAEGAGSTYLYIDLRDETRSPVVAFVYGLPEWTGLHQQDTVIQVAESFCEYLTALKFDATYYKNHLAKLIANGETQSISATIDYLELALPNWRELFKIDYDDGRPIQLKLGD